MEEMSCVMNNDEIMNLVESAITLFYRKLANVDHHRFKSWEYCYQNFIEARSRTLNSLDIDALSLHLAFYLASWGMYRGSSFLLQRDYKIHTPIVKELLKDKYDDLANINWIETPDIDTKLDLLDSLTEAINGYYAEVRKSVSPDLKNKDDISNILLTKILMGTLGCAPAYDRFFIQGIKSLDVSTGNFNRNSLKNLIYFYRENSDKLEKIRNSLHEDKSNLIYPQMKIIDMGFWQIGYVINSWEIEYKKNNKDSELPPLTFDDIKKLLEKESSEMELISI